MFNHCPDPLLSPLATAADYYKCIERTLRIVHHISCEALGMSDLSFFEQFYNPLLPCNQLKSSNPEDLYDTIVGSLKLSHYLPSDSALLGSTLLRIKTKSPSSLVEFDSEILYGAHSDYQGFTLLRPDPSDWYCLYTPPLDYVF